MGRDTARLRSLQRLDLADIENIQDFVTDYMSLALGGLFGYTRGLLTPPQVRETVGARSFNLTAFQVAISEQGDSHSHSEGNTKSDVKLQVVRFDPRDSNHLLNGVAITNGLISFNDGDAGKFLCVSAVPVDEDSQNRVFWSVASNTESAQSTTTATRTRLHFNWRTALELQGSDQQPSEYNDEAPILILTNASAGDAQRVKLISAWDDYRTYLFLEEDGANNWYDENSLIGVSNLLDEEIRPAPSGSYIDGFPGTYTPGSLNYTRDLGLNMLLALYRSRMRRSLSDGRQDDASVTKTSWATQPGYSLKGLNQKLDTYIEQRHTLRHQAIIHISKAGGAVSYDLIEDLSFNLTLQNASTRQEHNTSDYHGLIVLAKPAAVENLSHERSEIVYEFMTNNSSLADENNTPIYPGRNQLYARHQALVDLGSSTIQAVFVGNNFSFLVFSEDDFFTTSDNTNNGNSFILKVSIYGELDN